MFCFISTRFAVLFSAVFLVFFAILPALMIGSSPEDYGFFKWSIFIYYSSVFSFFVVVFVFLTTLLIHVFLGVGRAWIAAIFISSFLMLSGLMFPLIESDGLLDPAKADANYYNIIYTLILALALTYLSHTKISSVAYVFLGVTILSTFAFNFVHLIKGSGESGGVEEFLTVSGTKNVFVISFDGIPSNVVHHVFEDNQSIKDRFSDFVFYYNAIANAPATNNSIRNELFGNQNYHSFGFDTEASLSEYLNENYASKLPVNFLDNGFSYGYRFSERTLFRGDLAKSNLAPIISEHRYWFDLMVARVFTSYIYSKFNLGNINRYVEGYLLAEKKFGGMSDLITKYQGTESWKAPSLIGFDDYVTFVENLEVDSSVVLAFRQLHFTHTHFPIDFDSNCVMRSTDAEWARSVQNYEGLYEQAICELSQFYDFINRLKEMGIYDNSLIIFKSDHGEPVSYFDSSPHNLMISSHSKWGFNRYQPLLMIKNFNERSDQITLNGSLVTLADLALTTCLAVAKPERCDHFEGLDLLSNFNVDESSNIYLEIVESSSSDYQFDTHRTIQLDRTSGNTLYELLRSSPDVHLSE